MRNKNLTNAYIGYLKESSCVDLAISLSEIINNSKRFKYILVIQSSAEECIRVLIYPLYKKTILKLTFQDLNIPEKKTNDLLDLLQKFETIHTSGLVMKDNKLYYECYLNHNLAELEKQESKDLKTSLDMIKNIFKEIKIEQISLINNCCE